MTREEAVEILMTAREMYPGKSVIRDAFTLALSALQPSNEPLTLEKLREMDKMTPVWWTWNGCWCLCERGYITTPNGDVYGADEMNGLFYRRPPEGGADA